MADSAKQFHAARALSRASLSALACWLYACSIDAKEGEQKPATSPIQGDPDSSWSGDDGAVADAGFFEPPELEAGTPGEDPADAAPPVKVTAACQESAEQWLAIARANCAACHGFNSPARAGFSSVLDVPALIASGKVKPGNPDGSPLYVKLSSGVMPPANRTPRPSPADIESVKTWIECGAPAPAQARCQARCTSFVGIDARLDAMLKDVLALATPEERADARYLDLSNYANAGHGDTDLELQRDAIAYLVNSLSNAPKLVVPQAIDAQGLLFRIRLSDYGWNAATWERIAADYPYAVRYDVNSRNFPRNEPLAQALRERTGTATPYVQADWFVANASRPPLYYDVLRIPATLAELETQLGIDIQANIDGLRAARSGFTNSGPSRYNRVVERHSLGERGALWLTYDFSAGAGNSNVLANPLDFTATSSEILWNLPNGMQAYLITDGQGRRLNKAPSDAVQDPRSQDFAIEAGISCISCHTDQGLLAHADEVRAGAPASTADLDELAKILGLYQEKSAFDALLAADQARYRAARTALRPRGFVDGSAHTVHDAHLALLKLVDAAGVLGVEEAALKTVIDATPLVFASEITALRNGTSGIARDAFDAAFADLVTGIGLGAALAGP